MASQMFRRFCILKFSSSSRPPASDGMTTVSRVGDMGKKGGMNDVKLSYSSRPPASDGMTTAMPRV